MNPQDYLIQPMTALILCIVFFGAGLTLSQVYLQDKEVSQPAPFTQEALETYPALYSKKQCIENMKGYSMDADRYHECIDNYPELKEKEPVEVAQCPYLSPHVLRTSSPEADVISRIIKECESSLESKPAADKPRVYSSTYKSDFSSAKPLESDNGRFMTSDEYEVQGLCQKKGGTYDFEKYKCVVPLEYPLKSENFTLSHEFEQKNGSTTKDRYILESKKVGYTLWETEENWKEIYQLLKSKYE